MDIKKLVMKEEVPLINTPYELATKIAEFLQEKKAKDIKIIDLKGKTIVSDYFVVCSATSTTQVKALAEYVDEKLSKEYALEPRGRDFDNKWVAVDYNSVILHVFHYEMREFYNLERLWDDGNNIVSI